VDLLVLKFSHRVLCKLCPVAVAILNFRSTKKTHKTLEVYPLIILTKYQFNWSSGFRGVLWNFPFGTKLGRNIPWVDLYKVFIFGGSNLKHGRQGQLCVLIGWNFKELLWNHLTDWTVIWWEWWGDRPLQSFVGFFVDRKFKMATATGHNLHRTLWENCITGFFMNFELLSILTNYAN
jgi:hypothetical protein